MKREELFYLLMEQLLSEAAVFEQKKVQVPDTERLNAVCSYKGRSITVRTFHWNSSARLQASADTALDPVFYKKYKKITPHQHLESIRVNRAKLYLEQGTEPAEAAAMTGFRIRAILQTFAGCSA